MLFDVRGLAMPKLEEVWHNWSNTDADSSRDSSGQKSSLRIILLRRLSFFLYFVQASFSCTHQKSWLVWEFKISGHRCFWSWQASTSVEHQWLVLEIYNLFSILIYLVWKSIFHENLICSREQCLSKQLAFCRLLIRTSPKCLISRIDTSKQLISF